MRTLGRMGLGVLLCVAALFWGARTASAAGVVGNGTPASCTDAAIQTAMNSGNGTISFNCGPNPVTIEMTTKVVGNGDIYTFSGGGRVTLDGKDLIQLFIVSNGGNLTLRNIALVNANASQGSALNVASGGEATLFDVSVTDGGNDTNSGGAIYNAGTLLVEASFFMDNTADFAGGVLYNHIGATATVRNSHLVGNETIDPTEVFGEGGAIYNLGTLTVEGSTLFANDARVRGGGIYSEGGAVSIVNSTLAENTADEGGGIFAGVSPSFTLLNVTIERNNADAGGGLWNFGSSIQMKNTIVANSFVTADNGTPSFNCEGPSVTSGGRNLIGDGTCVSGSNASDIRNTNPNLSFINANGGFTPTLMPRFGSPAIDAGDNAGCPTVDQRGFPRPYNGTCDIGAVEFSVRVLLPLVER